MLTVFRTHPLIHVSYLVALIPGRRAARQRRDVDDCPRRLRRDRRLRALEHPPGLRAPRTDLRQPELPPHPPQGRRTAGRQPRLRADDLGPALPPGGVSDRGHDQDRHRAPGPAADRRAGGAAARVISRSSPRSSSRRSVRCTISRTFRRFGRRRTRPDAGATPGWELAAIATHEPRPKSARSVMVTTSVRRLRLGAARSWRPAQHAHRAAPSRLALIAVRIALAWIFIYHGSRRLFGWFDGPGIHAVGDVLREHRSPPSRRLLRRPRRPDRVRRRHRARPRPRSRGSPERRSSAT